MPWLSVKLPSWSSIYKVFQLRAFPISLILLAGRNKLVEVCSKLTRFKAAPGAGGNGAGEGGERPGAAGLSKWCILYGHGLLLQQAGHVHHSCSVY